MVLGHGRRIAILTTLAATLALGASSYAFRGRIQEEYWPRRLRVAGDAEKQAAAERLGELKSARAVPLLVPLLGKQTNLNGWTSYAPLGPEYPNYNYAETSLLSIGRSAVKELLQQLAAHSEYTNAIVHLLGQMGAEVREALPSLKELSSRTTTNLLLALLLETSIEGIEADLRGEPRTISSLKYEGRIKKVLEEFQKPHKDLDKVIIDGGQMSLEQTEPEEQGKREQAAAAEALRSIREDQADEP